jgi:hypothetical protein
LASIADAFGLSGVARRKLANHPLPIIQRTLYPHTLSNSMVRMHVSDLSNLAFASAAERAGVRCDEVPDQRREQHDIRREEIVIASEYATICSDIDDYRQIACALPSVSQISGVQDVLRRGKGYENVESDQRIASRHVDGE